MIAGAILIEDSRRGRGILGQLIRSLEPPFGKLVDRVLELGKVETGRKGNFPHTYKICMILDLSNCASPCRPAETGNNDDTGFHVVAPRL